MSNNNYQPDEAFEKRIALEVELAGAHITARKEGLEMLYGITFDNGVHLSVGRDQYSYGGTDGLLELAMFGPGDSDRGKKLTGALLNEQDYTSHHEQIAGFKTEREALNYIEDIGALSREQVIIKIAQLDVIEDIARQAEQAMYDVEQGVEDEAQANCTSS